MSARGCGHYASHAHGYQVHLRHKAAPGKLLARPCVLCLHLVLELCTDALGNRIELLWGEFEMRICEPHVCLALHGYKMYVCMGNFQAENALAYLYARDSLADGYSHFLGEYLQTGNLLVAQVKDIVHLVFGDDQRVALLQRVDIQESEVVLVFGNLIAGYLSCYYA